MVMIFSKVCFETKLPINTFDTSHVDKQTEACIAIMWLMFDFESMARGKSREDFESPLVTNIRSKPTDVWNNIYDYVGESDD
uniref:Calponin-homology (CH) domain-containing protein n=1 Tax=Heterorhabditis bacteriophora TaxID=37862 RepID=A0A1I7XC77_HETBA